MRILHLIPTLTGGGAERQLGYLSRELVRRGHEVRVAYINEGVGGWPHDEVQAIRLSRASSWDPRLLTQTLALMRKWRPDIVQSWIVQMDVIGGIATSLLRVPWLVREPTTAMFYGRAFKPELRLRLARMAVDQVVANSEGGLAYWADRAPKVPRTLIPNAIPIEQLDATAPAMFPHRTGIFLGRLESLKNIDIALSSVAAAASAADFDLLIVGDGPERARLEALTRSLGITDRVQFTGYRSDAWHLLKGAAFFVSLSNLEGSPNTVMEAFAARVPAILSDIPAHRALADDSMATFVPLRDVKATAKAMREATVTPAVHRARARIEPLSIARMTSAYEALYRELVEKGRH